MGRGRDRGPRRRGFEDDWDSPSPGRDDRPQQSFSRGPRERTAPSGPSVDATVKWFNADKGFGFVALDDGSADAFLHVGVLQAAGHESVDPGTKLSVQVGSGQKGRQVTAVVAMDANTGTAPPVTRSAPKASSGRTRTDTASAVEVEGIVKWFNAAKGFGFVACEDGEKDVFVHISIVERAGLSTLHEAQRVSMKVVGTQKGREAVSLTLLS